MRWMIHTEGEGRLLWIHLLTRVLPSSTVKSSAHGESAHGLSRRLKPLSCMPPGKYLQVNTKSMPCGTKLRSSWQLAPMLPGLQQLLAQFLFPPSIHVIRNIPAERAQSFPVTALQLLQPWNQCDGCERDWFRLEQWHHMACTMLRKLPPKKCAQPTQAPAKNIRVSRAFTKSMTRKEMKIC